MIFHSQNMIFYRFVCKIGIHSHINTCWNPISPKGSSLYSTVIWSVFTVLWGRSGGSRTSDTGNVSLFSGILSSRGKKRQIQRGIFCVGGSHTSSVERKSADAFRGNWNMEESVTYSRLPNKTGNRNNLGVGIYFNGLSTNVLNWRCESQCIDSEKNWRGAATIKI